MTEAEKVLRKNGLREEKGALVVEMALYFPFVLLIFLVFILAGMLLTQRAVLDRAVALTAAEVSAWKGSDMMPVNMPNPFGRQANEPFAVRNNPYTRFIETNLGANPFFPLNERDFVQRVRERVQHHNDNWSLVGRWVGSGNARRWTGGWTDPLNDENITVEHSGFFIARDVTIEATQYIRFPLMPNRAGWTVRSSSTVRLMRPYQTMNDFHTALDMLEMAFDFDMRNIGSALPDMIRGLQRGSNGMPRTSGR